MRIGAGTESLKFFLKQSLMSGGGVEKAKMKGKKKKNNPIYLSIHAIFIKRIFIEGFAYYTYSRF